LEVFEAERLAPSPGVARGTVALSVHLVLPGQEKKPSIPRKRDLVFLVNET
jgi:hypothetical protein